MYDTGKRGSVCEVPVEDSPRERDSWYVRSMLPLTANEDQWVLHLLMKLAHVYRH